MGRAYERDLELENLNQGPPPEQFYTCDQCGGEGIIYSAGWSYAPGCGYPHEDVEAHTCTACNGAGGWLDEAASEAKAAAEKVAEDSKIDPADLRKPVTI